MWRWSFLEGLCNANIRLEGFPVRKLDFLCVDKPNFLLSQKENVRNDELRHGRKKSAHPNGYVPDEGDLSRSIVLWYWTNMFREVSRLGSKPCSSMNEARLRAVSFVFSSSCETPGVGRRPDMFRLNPEKSFSSSEPSFCSAGRTRRTGVAQLRAKNLSNCAIFSG